MKNKPGSESAFVEIANMSPAMAQQGPSRDTHDSLKKVQPWQSTMQHNKHETCIQWMSTTCSTSYPGKSFWQRTFKEKKVCECNLDEICSKWRKGLFISSRVRTDWKEECFSFWDMHAYLFQPTTRFALSLTL